MTPPPEFSEQRRSFVKKSLATSVSISFAGLIRAHGEERTGTTAPETTMGTYSTTAANTGDTTEGFGTYATTAPETTMGTFATTVATTPVSDSKKRRWKCKVTIRGPKDTPYTQEELDDIDLDQAGSGNHPATWGPPTGPPAGSRLISGPVTEVYWDPSRPAEGVIVDRRRENGPTMSNWKDPETGKYYAAYLYDYVEEEFEIEIPDEP